MKYFTKGLVILGQILLWVFFGANLRQLYEKYLSVQDSLSRELLAGDTAKLLEIIRNSGTPIWLWILSVFSWLITTAILVGWFIPHWRKSKWFWRSNLIWLAIWLIYFAISIATLIVILNRLV
jgi:hypothetical protein